MAFGHLSDSCDFKIVTIGLVHVVLNKEGKTVNGRRSTTSKNQMTLALALFLKQNI